VRKALLLSMAFLLSGCTSVGTLGLVMKSTGDPGALLRNAQQYKELGYVEGDACRYFLGGTIPWGDATLSKAVDNALASVEGDGMLNVTVTNSLYGFMPLALYNVIGWTCTDVKGIAIKLQKN